MKISGGLRGISRSRWAQRAAAGACLLALTLSSASLSPGLLGGEALAQACTREMIASVIDKTGADLRKLNGSYQPAFQAKLRRLAERKGWPETEIESRGADFLQDDEATTLDEQANQLLTELDQLGDETAGDQATCSNRLVQLRTISAQLLEVTAAKAALLSAKLDAALGAQGDEPATVSGGKVATAPPAAVELKPLAPPDSKGGETKVTQPSPEAKAPPQRQASLEAPPPGERKASPKAWETDTQRNREDPPAPPGRPVDVAPPPLPPVANIDPAPGMAQGRPLEAGQEFTAEDISAAGRGFFGSMSAGLAGVIEYAFRSYGRPNGYILGTEGGGAVLAGLRYGDGRLVTKLHGEQKVYWQGPSVGLDFGVAGSRVMFLVYNLRQQEDMFARFAGIEGSAYVVGGVGITFLKKGRVIIAPIRTGLGLRVGANIGYLKFTPKASINPF